MTPGIKKVALGDGSTLDALLHALRKWGMPEEPVRQKLALGARPEWRTDVLLTGERLSEDDVLAIVACMVAVP